MKIRRLRRPAIAMIATIAVVLATAGIAFAAVSTDQADYSPGSVVTISGDNSNGAGYLAGETVHVDVSGPNDYTASCDGTADDNGAWSCQVTLNADESAIGDYTYTATGQASGATEQGTFTDGVALGSLNCPLSGYNPTHWALQENQTVTCTIDGASDVSGSTVDVFVKSSTLSPANETVVGTVSGTGSSTQITFTYTGRSDACLTSIVAYREVGNLANNALIPHGSGQSAAGFAWVDANGADDTDCTAHPPCEPNCVGDTAVGLDISKDAAGSYDTIYGWGITKSVDKTVVKQNNGGTATFHYTVSVSHDGGTPTNVQVAGTITVTNDNPDPVDITGVTDQLSDFTVCDVTGGGAQALPPGETDFSYSCDLGAVPDPALTNTATVTWGDQELATAGHLDGDSTFFTTGAIDFTATGTLIDECVSVNDTYAGSLGNVCNTDTSPMAILYDRTITVPSFDCKSYDNTAAFTAVDDANDTGATGSASKTVTVCGPEKTGALTIGYWNNKNGQAQIKNGTSTAGVCNSGTSLRQYNPFKDLSATATCTTVATYVSNVIKAASASGASMNAMLKGQMLATALNAYFISGFGGVSVDLTLICTDLTCTAYENSSPEFGGSPKTVLEMLSAASSQSNVGGSTWYGQVKLTQEFAKDAFDALNNEKVFAP